MATLSGAGHRWIDILAQFTAPVLIATLILMLAALFGRLWLAGGVAGVVALLLLIAVSPQWFPARGDPKPGAPEITLYSANLYWENTDVDAIRASVAATDADVVVLIEMANGPAERMDEILPLHPHRLVVPPMTRPVSNRMVIASRFPLTPVQTESDVPGLNYLVARVDASLGPIDIVAVHLTRPWPYQYQWGQITQVMALGQVVSQLKSPVVVAGDFNSVSSARIGRQIQSDIGLIPAPGWPGTWPSALPSAGGITIDQVYRSPDLALIDRRLGQPTGSDHRPVVTRFTLSKPEPAP